MSLSFLLGLSELTSLVFFCQRCEFSDLMTTIGVAEKTREAAFGRGFAFQKGLDKHKAGFFATKHPALPPHPPKRVWEGGSEDC